MKFIVEPSKKFDTNYCFIPPICGSKCSDQCIDDCPKKSCNGVNAL